MIRYALNFIPNELEIKLDFKDEIIFTGSCFSDHISKRMKEEGFRTFAQPNGVVFNPISLLESFKRTFSHCDYTEGDLIFNNGYWHSAFHHGSFSEVNKTDVLKNINHRLHEFRNALKNCKFIFVTFGSSYVYQSIENKTIFANCHKLPQNLFTKNLLSVSDIFKSWEPIVKKLKEQSPGTQIIFTVSPVKHLKDGVIENNISKSTLILAIHELLKFNSNVKYFPAYELINDDLRDYRFYDSDGAHPNSDAIEYVYQKLKHSVFSSDAISFSEDMSKYNKLLKHKVQKESSDDYIKLMKHIEDSRQNLQEKYKIEL
ncbi:MAG: GSCFA domain-containing protein [Bacteroidia bacterium]